MLLEFEHIFFCHSQIANFSRARCASRPFLPDRCATAFFFFRDTSRTIFTQAAHCAVVFFVVFFLLCTPAYPQFGPLCGHVALRTPLFPPGAARQFFFVGVRAQFIPRPPRGSFFVLDQRYLFFFLVIA